MATKQFFQTLLEHGDGFDGVKYLWGELPLSVQRSLLDKGHLTHEEYRAILGLRRINEDPYINKQIVKGLDQELEVLGGG